MENNYELIGEDKHRSPSQKFKDDLSNRAKNAKISEETRKKMSESAKARVKRLGEQLR